MNARLFAAIVATSIIPLGVALAQPTVSDVATCNEEAYMKTRAPSASPGPGPEARPKAAPLPRTGEKTDPSGSVITGAPDPLVEGMAADRADDPAYRTAYRECMKRQTERSR